MSSTSPKPGSLKRLRGESRSTSPCPSESLSSCSEVSHALSSFSSRRTKNAPLRIAIEGNIAAGKSTFIKILSDLADENPEYRWYVQPEPLAKWTKKEAPKSPATTQKTVTKSPKGKQISDDPDGSLHPDGDKLSSGGGNLLEAFYKNPKRWAYTFEAYTFVTRMKQAKDADKEVEEDLAELNTTEASEQDKHSAITFFERSVYSSRLVFAENSFESGYLNSTEWSLYCDWTNYVLRTVKQLKLDGIIYLQCDPTVCSARMTKRSRGEEGGVPLDYLLALQKKHDNWLIDGKKEDIHKTVNRCLQDVPTLVLNCSEEFEENKVNRDEMLSKTREWLATIIDAGAGGRNEEISEEGSSDVFTDITNTPIFKSEKSQTLAASSTHPENCSDEENDTVLPKMFQKNSQQPAAITSSTSTAAAE